MRALILEVGEARLCWVTAVASYDLTSFLSSVTSQISEDSSYSFLLSSPAERHL